MVLTETPFERLRSRFFGSSGRLRSSGQAEVREPVRKRVLAGEWAT